MTHLETIALDLLREAPVNSPALQAYREQVVRDPEFSLDLTRPLYDGDIPPIDPEYALQCGNPLLRIARMEQRATYLLAVAVCLYRMKYQPWFDRDTTLLSALKYYHEALQSAHREEIDLLRRA